MWCQGASIRKSLELRNWRRVAAAALFDGDHRISAGVVQ